MAKKPIIRAEAKAVAKFEASAKASFERKKLITEIIPPDVTRAKAGAWLDIISPITQWARLKSDALWYRRQQLRIQQEVALDQLARAVQRKMKGRKVTRPLPAKILVPALEGASLEEEDSPLIDWWANLLVSGATGDSTRIYFFDLMKAIGLQEASCLNEIWSKYAGVELYRNGTLEAGLRTVFNARGWIDEKISKFRGRQFTLESYMDHFCKILDELGLICERNGALTVLTLGAIVQRDDLCMSHKVPRE